MRQFVIIFCLMSHLGTALAAAPERYDLDAARSVVGFSYEFQGTPRDGAMPVGAADLLIDLDDLSQSRVSVSLDARGAQAGFIFATQVMKGPDVLDTANHPAITFRSNGFQGGLDGATVTGDLTVRGVTRPVTLRAGLYRQRGTAAGERDNLSVLLTGEIDRTIFGADGFPGYVGPMIRLRILARITRARR